MVFHLISLRGSCESAAILFFCTVLLCRFGSGVTHISDRLLLATCLSVTEIKKMGMNFLEFSSFRDFNNRFLSCDSFLLFNVLFNLLFSFLYKTETMTFILRRVKE